MDIKPIETIYKGYRFRSRLEARWAVFFDALEWNWLYEAEGFKINGYNYLPDFYFPDLEKFAEVKPQRLTEKELQKCLDLSRMQDERLLEYDLLRFKDVLLLEGDPDQKSYRCLTGGEEVSEFVFCPIWDKYYPMFYNYGFDPEYFSDTVKAINKARSARFEFGAKP